MIKGNQIPVASNVSRLLCNSEGVTSKLALLERELQLAGLNDHAQTLRSIRELVYEAASKLDQAARETYVAARRGEEIPK